jgi:hypothetical protein
MRVAPELYKVPDGGSQTDKKIVKKLVDIKFVNMPVGYDAQSNTLTIRAPDRGEQSTTMGVKIVAPNTDTGQKNVMVSADTDTNDVRVTGSGNTNEDGKLALTLTVDDASSVNTDYTLTISTKKNPNDPNEAPVVKTLKVTLVK